MTTKIPPGVLNQPTVQDLCQRVREGDEAEVEQLLRQNPGLINEQEDSSGLCPLHFAARYNQPNIVGILLHRGAEINAKSRDQELTALHIAARLIDRKRLAAEEQATTDQQQADDGAGFLNFLSQENDVTPTPAPATSNAELTTTDRLMNDPNIDPNIPDKLGETPLHYAARWGNAVECRVILAVGGRNVQGRKQVKVNEKDKDGMTPLHHVCLHMCSKSRTTQSRHLGELRHYHEIASLLIQHDANILATDNNENTPLHLAADEGCKEITEELLDAAASAGTKTTQELLSMKNLKGDTALNIAVRRNYYEVTRFLLSRGTNEIGVANKDGDTPLHNCKHTGIFDTLLENLPNIKARNKAGATPLHVAARDGRIQIVRKFETLTKEQRQKLDEKEFFNCTDNENRTPLLIASQYGQSAVVHVLLKNPAVNNGAKDKNGKTALYLAAENNHDKVLEAMFDGEGPMLGYLEDSGTEKLHTPLHIAAINGHLEIVKLLQQNGALVRAKHHGGKTPLHLACQYGQYEVVRELVSYESAVIHDTTDKKYSPLHWAAMNGHFRIVQFLIECKLQLDAVTDKGETALFLAAKEGWDKTCRVLINSGADVTIMTDKTDQKTPLQIACKEGHIKVVEIFLLYWREMMDKAKEKQKPEDGTKINWEEFISHRDSNWQNCLDLAIQNGHEDVAELIIETEGAWDFVLENCDLPDPMNPMLVNTPMRKLIKFMPGVAEAVFNKCITEGTGPGKIIFNYKYLDDQNERLNWTKKTESSKIEDEQRSYKTYKKTHVLTVLAKSEKMELLSHPLVSALLMKKNQSYAMWIFYLQLFVYILFLAFLTAFMVISIPPYEFATDTYNKSGDGHMCEQVDAGGHRQPTYLMVLQYITLMFSAILLISEVIQLYQKKKGYFEFDNLIEWIIFVFAIIVTIDFTPCSDATGYRYTWQWSIGTASLFFGWINLALYLQKFPTIGIYIMMFKDILGTFLEFVIVYVLFVIAFALAFYSEIRSMAAYNSFGLSLVKTAVMMIGEFDYGDDFVGAELHNTAAVYILFVCFMIVMTILVMNLLVGLAVDDIKEIQNKANLKRLQMSIDLVLELESVVQVGLCCQREGSMEEEIQLQKPRKLPFNLSNYIGKESFGLTKEAIDRAKNPEKTEVGKLQEEQQNLRQQNDKLKLKLKEQGEILQKLDKTLQEVLRRLPEPH